MLKICLILLVCILVIGIKFNSNFEFRKVSTACNEFKVSGSISYNNKKSAIYISNIDYCGEKDTNVYSSISCVLYEKNNNTTIKISEYQINESSTLDNFLKKVEFNIDNYSKTCKKYNNDSLYLEIKAYNGKMINYTIPLSLENC